MSTISLDEEVRLYSTNAEREKYSTQATLFGIIISLDYLERAYVRDSITAAECVFSVFCFIFVLSDFQYLKRYSPACTRLLSQYKTMLKLLGSDVPSVDEFMKRYRVSSGQKTRCVYNIKGYIVNFRWIILPHCIELKLGFQPL